MIQKIWHNLLRFGFRLLYNELAWTYDLISWAISLGAWRDWQHAALPFVQGRSVLEIAHGPGHMLLALNQAGFDVVGLDLSVYMGKQAQRRLHKNDLSLPLLRAAAQALPLADNTFDTVLTTFPTDFVFEFETLTAVYRVLNGNGRFIIVPAGVLNGNNFVHRSIEWLYAITGQRQTESSQESSNTYWPTFKQQCTTVGFEATIHQISLDNSSATVIVAQK